MSPHSPCSAGQLRPGPEVAQPSQAPMTQVLLPRRQTSKAEGCFLIHIPSGLQMTWGVRAGTEQRLREHARIAQMVGRQSRPGTFWFQTPSVVPHLCPGRSLSFWDGGVQRTFSGTRTQLAAGGHALPTCEARVTRSCAMDIVHLGLSPGHRGHPRAPKPWPLGLAGSPPGSPG